MSGSFLDHITLEFYMLAKSAPFEWHQSATRSGNALCSLDHGFSGHWVAWWMNFRKVFSSCSYSEPPSLSLPPDHHDLSCFLPTNPSTMAFLPWIQRTSGDNWETKKTLPHLSCVGVKYVVPAVKAMKIAEVIHWIISTFNIYCT